MVTNHDAATYRMQPLPQQPDASLYSRREESGVDLVVGATMKGGAFAIDQERATASGVTPSQMRIVAALALGCDEHQIAEAYTVSRQTVSSHLRRAMTALALPVRRSTLLLSTCFAPETGIFTVKQTAALNQEMPEARKDRYAQFLKYTSRGMSHAETAAAMGKSMDGVKSIASYLRRNLGLSGVALPGLVTFGYLSGLLPFAERDENPSSLRRRSSNRSVPSPVSPEGAPPGTTLTLKGPLGRFGSRVASVEFCGGAFIVDPRNPLRITPMQEQMIALHAIGLTWNAAAKLLYLATGTFGGYARHLHKTLDVRSAQEAVSKAFACGQFVVSRSVNVGLEMNLAVSKETGTILKSLAQGTSNQQIAEAIGLSEDGLKNHLKIMRRHFGVTGYGLGALVTMGYLTRTLRPDTSASAVAGNGLAATDDSGAVPEPTAQGPNLSLSNRRNNLEL